MTGWVSFTHLPWNKPPQSYPLMCFCVCLISIQSADTCATLFAWYQFWRKTWRIQSRVTQPLPFSLCLTIIHAHPLETHICHAPLQLNHWSDKLHVGATLQRIIKIKRRRWRTHSVEFWSWNISKYASGFTIQCCSSVSGGWGHGSDEKCVRGD